MGYFTRSFIKISNASAIFSKVERVGFIRPFSMLLIYARSTLKTVARSHCDIFFSSVAFLGFSRSFLPVAMIYNRKTYILLQE